MDVTLMTRGTLKHTLGYSQTGEGKEMGILD